MPTDWWAGLGCILIWIFSACNIYGNGRRYVRKDSKLTKVAQVMQKCVGSWRQSVQPSSDSPTPLVNCNCRLSGCVESRGRLVEICGHQAGYAAFGFGSTSHCYGNLWGMLTSATPLSTSLPACVCVWGVGLVFGGSNSLYSPIVLINDDG